MAGFSGHWAFIFGVLGNIISLMVYLAPVPTFRKIYKKKSSVGFQSIPYVVALFSSIIWIYYAFLKPDNTLVLTINSVGCFIETIYIGFHFFYASKKSRVQTLTLLGAFIVLGIGIIFGTHLFVKSASKRGDVVGWICLVLSLCVFVAPLGILRKVIQTKSVKYMPVLLSLFLTLSAVMWFFYGLLLNEFVIYIPNVLGFGFGLVQMILYLIYKNADKIDDKKLPVIVDEIKNPEIIDETNAEEIHVEMGQNQATILDENKNPELILPIDEIVKPSVLSCPKQILVVSPLHTNGIEASQRHNLDIESRV